MSGRDQSKLSDSQKKCFSRCPPIGVILILVFLSGKNRLICILCSNWARSKKRQAKLWNETKKSFIRANACNVPAIISIFSFFDHLVLNKWMNCKIQSLLNRFYYILLLIYHYMIPFEIDSIGFVIVWYK